MNHHRIFELHKRLQAARVAFERELVLIETEIVDLAIAAKEEEASRTQKARDALPEVE